MIKKYSILILFFLLVTVLGATAQNSPFVGQWKFDWNLSFNALTPEARNKFNALPEATRNRVTSSFSSRTFTFSQNGDVVIEWQGSAGAASENGTWSVQGTNLDLEIGETQRHYSFSLNAGVLNLSMESQGAMFSNLILIKL